MATLCHGPQVLAAAGVLDGYELTSYPAVRPECEAAGCTWVDEVTTDGNLVTAQAWPDHAEWLSQFLDVLGTRVEHGDPVVADD
nr:DJ-1/PfpI family protein [Halobacterium jilantaiense]